MQTGCGDGELNFPLILISDSPFHQWILQMELSTHSLGIRLELTTLWCYCPFACPLPDPDFHLGCTEFLVRGCIGVFFCPCTMYNSHVMGGSPSTTVLNCYSQSCMHTSGQLWNNLPSSIFPPYFFKCNVSFKRNMSIHLERKRNWTWFSTSLSTCLKAIPLVGDTDEPKGIPIFYELLYVTRFSLNPTSLGDCQESLPPCTTIRRWDPTSSLWGQKVAQIPQPRQGSSQRRVQVLMQLSSLQVDLNAQCIHCTW